MSANWSESLGGDTVVIVDSQTQLSPQLVEIPNGVPSASSLMQSDQNTVAENADERPALDDEQAMDDDSGMDDPSAGGLGLRAVLISVLAGTAIAVIGLGLRSRNR